MLRSFLHRFRSQTLFNLNLLSVKLDRNDQRDLISNNLDTVEQAAQEIGEQMSTLATWRRALQNQDLDESILPPSRLAETLQAATDKGCKFPSLDWIYTFVKIKALWSKCTIIHGCILSVL